MKLTITQAQEDVQNLGRRKSFHESLQSGGLSPRKKLKRQSSEKLTAPDDLFDHDLSEDHEVKKNAEKSSSERDQPQENSLKTAQNLGVPKFLVNKWLNVKTQKSKFVLKSCQVDNFADVSEYSVRQFKLNIISEYALDNIKSIKFSFVVYLNLLHILSDLILEHEDISIIILLFIINVQDAGF